MDGEMLPSSSGILAEVLNTYNQENINYCQVSLKTVPFKMFMTHVDSSFGKLALFNIALQTILRLGPFESLKKLKVLPLFLL